MPMYATRYARWAGGILALGLGLLASGCPETGEEPSTNDMLPAADMRLADMGLGPDRGADTKDVGPDATPIDAALPDAAPPAEQGRMPELCVGCGAAASRDFRLIEHGLHPLPDGPARRATSPRFRLILDP